MLDMIEKFIIWVETYSRLAPTITLFEHVYDDMLPQIYGILDYHGIKGLGCSLLFSKKFTNKRGLCLI